MEPCDCPSAVARKVSKEGGRKAVPGEVDRRTECRVSAERAAVKSGGGGGGGVGAGESEGLGSGREERKEKVRTRGLLVDARNCAGEGGSPRRPDGGERGEIGEGPEGGKGMSTESRRGEGEWKGERERKSSRFLVRKDHIPDPRPRRPGEDDCGDGIGGDNGVGEVKTGRFGGSRGLGVGYVRRTCESKRRECSRMSERRKKVPSRNTRTRESYCAVEANPWSSKEPPTM